ncbi:MULTISPECIES: hypothetical protein [Dermabacter]|uniref:hypothetical protein n=1 Tax=Dermabacter TaxID=36739 RepID=UPI0003A24790|nr:MULTISPECIES: hypothetical protein [Dermabacter]MCT1708857.1 hypothetical protein [Dermabacter hominis]MDU4922904.1 hypothetical protein [Dermabacter sp.]
MDDIAPGKSAVEYADRAQPTVRMRGGEGNPENFDAFMHESAGPVVIMGGNQMDEANIGMLLDRVEIAHHECASARALPGGEPGGYRSDDH